MNGNTGTMNLITVEKHRSKYPDPVRFEKKERLAIAQRDSDYEGWVWVKTSDGRQGWAPEQYLDVVDTGRAIAKRDYSARELNTQVGEALILHYEVNDWGWVEKQDGSSGWVPMNTTGVV